MSMKIALATPKGGSGKSTLTMLLAGEFGQSGLSVLILDTDPQKSVALWFERCVKANAKPKNVKVEVVSDEAQLVKFLSADGPDITLVDVQGTANQMLAIAAAHCDLVVVPCIPSELDATQALKIPRYLDGFAGRGRAATPYRVVLNAVDGIEMRSRAFTETVVGMHEAGVKLANTIVTKRQNYRLITNGRGSLHLIKDKDDALLKAIANIEALANELMDVVNSSNPEGRLAQNSSRELAETAMKVN